MVRTVGWLLGKLLTVAIVAVSHAPTPNKSVESSRAKPSAPANPATKPASIIHIPPRKANPSKLPLLAPNAARIPISFVRCAAV